MRIVTKAVLALSFGLALACGGGASSDFGGMSADLPAEWVDYGVDVGDGNVFMVNDKTTIVKYPASADAESIVAGWRKPLDDAGFKELYKSDSNGIYTLTLKHDDGKVASFNVLEVLGEKQLSATLPK